MYRIPVASFLAAALLFPMVNLKGAPPESSVLISFPPSTAQKWILPNGLTVIVQEDHSAPVASVQWMRDEPWHCVVSVTDDVDRGDDLIPFAGNGQYSELPRRYWIEVAAARGAVRHYLRTG